MREKKVEWIFEQHESTNHMYDTYLPYSFHLRMVHTAAQRHIGLVPDLNDGKESFRDAVLLAAFGHDLIEDTRVSYNDVKSQLGLYAADIIYACSNEKGKTRAERANDSYYEGIRNTPGATFVKLCDRIANVQYSKMTQSRMFEMYSKENTNFVEKLGYSKSHVLAPLFNELIELFKTK
jgi:(p)ppGpp synthase/HD superfamily hydrolase